MLCISEWIVSRCEWLHMPVDFSGSSVWRCPRSCLGKLWNIDTPTTQSFFSHPQESNIPQIRKPKPLMYDLKTTLCTSGYASQDSFVYPKSVRLCVRTEHKVFIIGHLVNCLDSDYQLIEKTGIPFVHLIGKQYHISYTSWTEKYLGKIFAGKR